MLNDLNKQIQTGQTIQHTLLESGCFQITLLPPDQAGPKIIEVGTDYLILEDVDAGVKTRIPGHLIRTLGVPQPVPNAA